MKKVTVLILLLTSIYLWSDIKPEKWEYDVKFGMIKAGTGSLQINNAVYNDSIPVYKILFTARTNKFFDTFYKVRDEIVSWWRKDSLIPLEFTKKLKEHKYRQRRTHYYYHDQLFSMYYNFSFKKHKLKEKRIEILANTQDILSAFYLFRTYDLKVGESYNIDITVDGKNFPAEINVLRKETIKTEIGEKKCFVVQPKLASDAVFRQKGNIFIWITDDEDRIPVKVRSKIVYGSFYAILTSRELL